MNYKTNEWLDDIRARRDARINRVGGPIKADRPWTAYEDGQIRSHYPTKGPRGMAADLHRTPEACRKRWKRLIEGRNAFVLRNFCE